MHVRAKKHLGQHFLRDLDAARRIAEGIINYSISKEGRVSDIKVTSIFGAGRLSKKEALQLWTIVTEDTFYEPIEIEGKRYEINNCKGVGWFPLRN